MALELTLLHKISALWLQRDDQRDEYEYKQLDVWTLGHNAGDYNSRTCKIHQKSGRSGGGAGGEQVSPH